MSIAVSLLNMKGGVGKTSLAVTLASYEFVRNRKRVLLLDFDPQFNASQFLMSYDKYQKHVTQHGTIADLLIDQPVLRLRSKPKKPSVQNCIVRLEGGRSAPYFDFLPAELALAHVVKNPHQMEYRLEKILNDCRANYDYVFIDCAPTDSILTTMALTASNYILVPVKPDRFSILGFGNLLQTIQQFRENSPNPNEVQELGIVFTLVHGDSDVEDECVNEVRRQANKYHWHVFSASVPYSTTFQRAIRDQTAPFQTKWARQGLKRALSLLAKEVDDRIAELSED